MKRIIVVAIAILMLLASFVACDKETDVYEIDKSYDSRTAAFYGHIAENQFFWFDMDLTQNGETHNFVQATNGNNVTTILDFENNANDKYEIAVKGEKAAIVHTIHLNEKKYDTTISEQFQDFLFGGEDPKAFSEPDWSGDTEFQGVTLYCEMFKVASNDGGVIDGYNKYYYDEGRLVAVEIAQNDKVTMTMQLKEYGVEVPEGIYLNPPTDFKKGTFQVESVIDYSEMGWD
jgi:hypothetical protein